MAGGRALENSEPGAKSSAEKRVDGDDEDWIDVAGGGGGSADPLGEDKVGGMATPEDDRHSGW